MLKNVLSLLLSKFYSKKESSLVAHQAMPNFENAVALSLTTGNDGTYVAPADGYINVEVESSGYVNFWGGILDSASNGLWNKVAVPVSKGRTVRYHIEGQVVYAAFINLVGGGHQALKNALLQGGGLCLNSLSSSLRKSSLSVKRSGCSKTLSPLKEPQLLSQINDQVLHLLRILLRQTDCLGFVIKQVRGITLHCLAIASVTEVTQQDGNFLRLTDGQLNTHFMYLREKSSNLIQTTKRQVLPECGSTRRLNSAVGGASC